MRTLAIAIVGCGRMGRERARCVRQLNHRIRFVVDTNAARAGELAREYNAVVMGDVRDCLSSGVDAVFLCTPPGLRGAVLDSCLQHVVPFFVEKPIAVSTFQCEELAERIRNTPVIHAVGFMNRYRRSVQFGKKVLAGRKVIAITAHWICSRYNVPWVDNEQLSGGPYNDQAIHAVDLSRFFAGQVGEVQSIFQSPERAGWLLAFESGTIASVVYSCEARTKNIGFQIFTEQGALRFEGWDFKLAENTIDGTLPEYSDEDVFLTETKAFMNAVQSGLRDGLLSDMPDAMETQLVIDAARQSHASGNRVNIAEFVASRTRQAALCIAE
ncbi:MAG TPA: Gfo/Idh/MocA family oxidoreductase [Bryobacteraceae bacterium]|jgi:predicted dehydrogenase